jgi:FkbM family methyltransferase
MLPQVPLLGKILRLPLFLIPQDAEVRILQGPLRGKKWIKGSGPNSYWLGTFEVERVRALANAMSPGATVYDIGANVGIYTLLSSSRVGGSGAVYAFEPLERNLAYLRKHVVLNKLQNCTIVEQAIGNREGERLFSAIGGDFCAAKFSPDGDVSVPTTTLDACIYGAKRFRPPDVLKIDVEGAEFEVLQGAARAISEFCPMIFVEIHGTQLHADCREFLLGKGYRIEESYGQLTATRARDS